MRELRHRCGNNIRRFGIKPAGRLASLKEDIRILGGSAHDRMFGAERPLPMRADEIIINHRPDIGVIDQRQRVDLMRGSEPVKEMHERYARLERRSLCDKRHVMGFLHRIRGEQRKAG